MKRVYIVVEGQTEQEFVNEVLSPYLNQYNIFSVTPVLIKTSRISRGGFVNYKHLKNTILPLLKTNKSDIIVTTLVDFFRIPTSIPNYEKSLALNDKLEKVSFLQQSIDDDINDLRFFSYIQLHEFEALVFSNNNGFEKYCSNEIASKTELIVNEYLNPENINTTPQGAPSKRILSIIDDYDKVLYGNLFALEVGINEMLLKCSRFNTWVQFIIKQASSKF